MKPRSIGAACTAALLACMAMLAQAGQTARDQELLDREMALAAQRAVEAGEQGVAAGGDAVAVHHDQHVVGGAGRGDDKRQGNGAGEAGGEVEGPPALASAPGASRGPPPQRGRPASAPTPSPHDRRRQRRRT